MVGSTKRNDGHGSNSHPAHNQSLLAYDSKIPVGNLLVENVLWEFLAHMANISVYDRAPVVEQYAAKLEQVRADRYLSERQVVKMWPDIFTRRALQEWRRLRKGPKYFVMHRKILYLKEDIETYIESHILPPSL
jgi:hypothetical protein